MTGSDAFSEYYAELLQGTYDCVDRIVLNAFFPFGQTGGGVRTWWRWLRGDDLTLDNEHLREMAGTFSRRLHAFCAKQRIPLIEAQARDRKHQLAQLHLPTDPKFCGLFLVIKSNAPAPIWEVKRPERAERPAVDQTQWDGERHLAEARRATRPSPQARQGRAADQS